MIRRLDWSACQALEEDFISIKTTACFRVDIQRYDALRKQIGIIFKCCIIFKCVNSDVVVVVVVVVVSVCCCFWFLLLLFLFCYFLLLGFFCCFFVVVAVVFAVPLLFINDVLSYSDHGEFMVGSLSHLMNARASGYQELPDFPEVPPDPAVRNVEVRNFSQDFFKDINYHRLAFRQKRLVLFGLG